MAVISPAPKDGLLRSLYGGDDLHLFASGERHEGDINEFGEIWHKGKWCKILRRVANIYIIDKEE